MLYAFFWVIRWHLKFKCQRFGKLCQFHLHRRVPPAYEDGTDRVFWTLAYKLQTPVNHLEESIQHSGHGESLKSSMFVQLNILRQRDTSRCEGFLPFQGLTGTLKMGTESVPEMSENLHILTRLSAREYFTKVHHCGSCKNYNNVYF
jgi:hypothetical protein